MKDWTIDFIKDKWAGLLFFVLVLLLAWSLSFLAQTLIETRDFRLLQEATAQVYCYDLGYPEVAIVKTEETFEGSHTNSLVYCKSNAEVIFAYTIGEK